MHLPDTLHRTAPSNHVTEQEGRRLFPSAGLALLRLLGRAPSSLRSGVARALAEVLLRDPVSAEMILANLLMCFPGLDNAQRRELARHNAFETARAVLDRFRLWQLDERGVRENVTLEGIEYLHAFMGTRPLVLLCPHFLGVEAAAQRLSLEGRMATLYRPSAHAAFDAWRVASRSRFNAQVLTPLGAPLGSTMRAVRRGMPLFLLPDLDSGLPDALFSPFFGVRAATVRTTAWCVAHLDAVVVPVSVRRLQDDRYVTSLHAPIPLDGRDLQVDTDRVNLSIEALVAEHPAHYWWCQPRFATRPPGAPACYSDAVLERAAASHGRTFTTTTRP